MSPILNFRILGQGTPVIILHGLFGMLDNWVSFGKKLEDAGYMAVLLDQRDHGRSEHTTDFSYPLLAGDLRRFMDENWMFEAIMMGHSMGGKTCLQFVNEFESYVRKLIIVDMGIKQNVDGHQAVFDALFSFNPDKINSRNEAQSAMMQYVNDPATVQFLMKNLTRKKDGGYEWKMNLPLLHEKYTNIIEAIRFNHPVDTEALFIRGSRSDYILDEDWPEIQQTFPNATLKTVEGAGHWVHADRPDELFQIIIDFI
ncbi:MAG: alpha/beta fold hydrolase [Saprospiraceae bacterium]|nr:MAG: alpha/beta hydrolase [Bacteroidetes bacterium OLB9]MCO6463606.1 alpha/beta fold hydrolase [Saprospiraceae bacterium]MCZ2338001.1 alpha/beta fold hydrolase [Chitinophagales bacterium]